MLRDVASACKLSVRVNCPERDLTPLLEVGIDY